MAKYEEMMDIIYLRDAWSCLTQIQRRRMRAYFFEDRTIKQIAEMEGVDSKAIRKSISQSKEKILDYFKAGSPFARVLSYQMQGQRTEVIRNEKRLCDSEP